MLWSGGSELPPGRCFIQYFFFSCFSFLIPSSFSPPFFTPSLYVSYSLSTRCPSFSQQQDLGPARVCCGLLGANRFCQLSSQRPCYGFVTLPSLQRGWRGWPGTQGLEGGWGSGWRARSKKKRWRCRQAVGIEGDGQQPGQKPASEVTQLPPTAATNHSPKSSSGSTGVILCGIGAFQCPSFSWQPKCYFGICFSITSGMAFGGTGIETMWACVYQTALNYYQESHGKRTYD